MAKANKKTKKDKKLNIFNLSLYLILGLACLVAVIVGVNIKITSDTGEIVVTPNYTMSEEQIPGFIEDDQGEIKIVEDIPTLEEVDGGQFEDEITGVSVIEGEYEDLGWAEWYPTDTPEAFRNATIGKCIRAGNRFGSQCVSLSRVYWWSYADRDVSTCGTGMAKGMMNCWQENAGDDFEVYWADAKSEIQAGDWLVFTGGQYGHVGMALGSLHDGYVTLLGENQSGIPCEGGGSATNIININIKNLIGFYRPKAYVKPVEPEPIAPNTGIVK